MKTVIRQNLLLVSAVALPVIVILFYIGASLLPRYFVAPPRHDLVVKYQPNYYHYNNDVAQAVPSRVAIVVADGRARATVTEVPGDENPPRPVQPAYYLPRVFRYEAATGRLSELDVPIPDDLAERPRGSEWPIPALERVTLSAQATAPDGYVFDTDSDRGHGLAVELFGGRSRRDGTRIRSSGRIIKIPSPDDLEALSYYGNRMQLVGWVVAEEGDNAGAR